MKENPNASQQGDASPAATPQPTSCAVVVKRPFKIGGREVKPGELLAEVRLAPTVDLNILVDAVRNGLAGDAPQKK